MSYKITENYITPNQFSRPQIPMKKVKALVIHWFANPNTSALSCRNYFNNLPSLNANKSPKEQIFASAHEAIGLQGEVIKIVPPSEICYHVGSETYTQIALDWLSSYPNNCTYGIECAHLDMTGKMTDATYNTLVERCVDLCREFGLNIYNLWLHQEVVGWKPCHKWFVDHTDEWEKFKQTVGNKLNNSQTQVDIPTEQPKEEYKVESLDGIQKIVTADALNVRRTPFIKDDNLLAQGYYKKDTVIWVSGYVSTKDGNFFRITWFDNEDAFVSANYLVDYVQEETKEEIVEQPKEEPVVTTDWKTEAMKYLKDNGYIVDDHEPDEPMTFAQFGTIMKSKNW